MKTHWEEELKRAMSDQSEPFPGHEERFEMRLMQAQKPKGRTITLPRWPWMAAAAAVVVGLIVTLVTSEIHKANHMADDSLKDLHIPEIAAAETYYKKYATVDFNSLNTNDPRIQQFAREMKRLEDEYAKLSQLLAQNYNNERIAQAMVENFQFRLKIMEQLRKYIEIQNQLKNPNNEQQIAS